MGWAEVRTLLLVTWASVSGSHLTLVIGLVAAIGAIWILMSWRYGASISTLRVRLKAAEKEIRGFEVAFAGMTHAQAAARLKRLESYLTTLPPRRLSEDQMRAISAVPCPPAETPYLTIIHDGASDEASRFAQDLKDAFSAAPGWNVVEDRYPHMIPNAFHGITLGLADPGQLAPVEQLVIGALLDAGLVFDRAPKAGNGEGVELIIAAR